MASHDENEEINLPFDDNNYSDPNELFTHFVGQPDHPRRVGTNYSSMFQIRGFFHDLQTLLAWARFMGRTKNMVLVTNRSWSNNVGFRTIRLVCERYGQTRKKKDVDPEFVASSSRDTRSKKHGCKFELEVTQENDKKWTVRVICGVHNHPLPEDLEGHAYAGRLTPAQYRRVEREMAAGIKPRNILTSLQLDDPNNVTSIRQIYNTGMKIRMEYAEGRGSIQQALHTLKDRGYYVSTRRTPNSDTIYDLFFMHPDSRHLLSRFPYVIVMDTTYKTNQYKMPLLEIVGITSTKKTFAVAFVFMAQETNDHYEWALGRLRHVCGDNIPEVIVTDRELGLIKALGIVFPDVKHMLCTWHIKTNIDQRSWSILRSKEMQAVFTSNYHALFESMSSGSYERRLAEMKVHWQSHPRLMEYLENTWLKDYKEAIIRAWCDLYHHFETRTTNV